METRDLFKLLEQHRDKSLLFEYAPNLLVQANYHITEVKHLKIDAVDCGGQEDSWRETIIQLWESPEEIGKRDFMLVNKALEILERVGKMKAFVSSAIIKFEYGNDSFHTAQLEVHDHRILQDQLILELHVPSTACKAQELCGVPQEKKEMDLDTLTSCTPGTGCC
ncbi:DUF6428 family protein [Gillisia sp. M10.2A]|uniref:DUF6428 family protein n=1 Tax=Gillisia lutea TaxID=2909668 RepID=A0ABS9EBY1_9FLAO|nr:DUF6428 family protein [Gillisia lutea]MCF4100352.1 DUF6428 family protein [Gillisia lutea]